MTALSTSISTPNPSGPKKMENATHDTLIGFGKFKGNKHSVLLSNENLKYAEWILNQPEDKFYYKATREYLMENFGNATEIDINNTLDKVLNYLKTNTNEAGELTISVDVDRKLRKISEYM